MSGASVTIERGSGGAIASLSTDHGGGFTAQLLTPGEYRVLVEQIGFQPVRVSGIIVAPGSATSLVITLQRRPPPITSVTEIASPGARGGGAPGVLVSGSALSSFDRPSDLTAAARVASVLVAPEDGRNGLALGAGGLDISHTRLFVDGVREILFRHPGSPSEPPSTPVFARQALNQIQFLGAANDLEWRAGPGSLVAAQTRTGSGRIALAPYATFSAAKLGQNKLDNPGDSTATSFQVGATLSASIVPDTAHLFIEGAYESLQQPTAAPWAVDSGRFNGAAGSLRDLIPTIGNDSFQVDLGRYAAPTVRSWKGGHGLARLDWQLGATNRFQARLGFATWKETNPLLGADLFAGTGGSLKARDLSGAAALTSTWAAFANEARVGFSMARREWKSDAILGTALAGDGIGFGASPLLPGTFDTKRLDLSDAVQYGWNNHRFKFGADVYLTNYEQDYRFASAGQFLFGDVDQFGRATGTFFQVAGPAETAR
ncbi:MAG TPA: carboxypeptidase-like regulatory domain-containing protein, partial [Gemmatimonadales bacterium]|nr:carboxypeptidase-like regulatory domain-containing protein [Gemmatimonadales bacterium]